MPVTCNRPSAWAPIMAPCLRCQRQTVETRAWSTPDGAPASEDVRCVACGRSRSTAAVRA